MKWCMECTEEMAEVEKLKDERDASRIVGIMLLFLGVVLLALFIMFMCINAKVTLCFIGVCLIVALSMWVFSL